MQVNSDYFNGLIGASQTSTSQTAESNSTALTQEDFFSLLTQQLAYQDPFEPADNSEMVSQMTSFSTSEGINSMSAQLASLNEVMTSNQALQASTLVGQKVLLPSNEAYWDQTDAVDGVIVAGEGADNVKVRVEDGTGQLIREITLEGSKRGNVPFSWDGLKDNGEPAATGTYQFKVSALVDNQREDINALMFARVDSVTLSSVDTPTLVNLSGLGGVALSQVLEIGGRNTN